MGIPFKRRKKKAALGAVKQQSLLKKEGKSSSSSVSSASTSSASSPEASPPASARRSAARVKKKPNPTEASIPHVVTKDYNSPLLTIDENDEGDTTAAAMTPATGKSLLNSVKLVNDDPSATQEESMEVVVQSPESEPPRLPAVKRADIRQDVQVVEEKGDEMEVVITPERPPHDDIRKNLFPEKEEKEQKDEYITDDEEMSLKTDKMIEIVQDSEVESNKDVETTSDFDVMTKEEYDTASKKKADASVASSKKKVDASVKKTGASVDSSEKKADASVASSEKDEASAELTEGASVVTPNSIVAEKMDDDDTKLVVVDSAAPVEATKEIKEEPPFDEKAEYEGNEDPTILNYEDSVIKVLNDEAPASRFKSDIQNAEVVQKVLKVFQCNEDTTQDIIRDFSCQGMDTFYDTMCGPVAKGKRPFYSKEFTRDFIEDSVKHGIPLMYHYEIEPGGSGGGWKGRSVTMYLKLGDYQGLELVHPRLEWPAPADKYLPGTTGPPRINLMDIQSVSDCSQEDGKDEVEALDTMDLCFFSITSKKGDVFMFESASPAERDWICTGIKNVLVRLSYHLIVGDAGISAELFSEEGSEFAAGDLPSLMTPSQAMNEVAHAFLD